MKKIFFVLVLFFEFWACSSGPKEVGFFIKTSSGWLRLQSLDKDIWSGGYNNVENLTYDNLPTSKVGTPIRIHKVPNLDPTLLFWCRNAKLYENVTKWDCKHDSQPVSARVVSDDLEISTEGLSQGYYALVYFPSIFSQKAYPFKLE